MLSADELNEWDEPGPRGMILTLIPAYGRDYTSAKDAHQAFLQGQDFSLQPSGVYTSIRDIPHLQRQHNIEAIHIKYKRRTRTHAIPLWTLR